jgi:hypothetical protein
MSDSEFYDDDSDLSESNIYNNDTLFFKDQDIEAKSNMYHLDRYDIDTEIKGIILKHLNDTNTKNVDIVLMIAALVVLIKNKWKIDENISSLCDDAIRDVILKKDRFVKDTDQVNERKVKRLNIINTKMSILRYCRYILEKN